MSYQPPEPNWPDPGRAENEDVDMRPWWVLLGALIGCFIAVLVLWGPEYWEATGGW